MEGRKEELTLWHHKFEKPVGLAGGAVMQAIKCEPRAQKRGLDLPVIGIEVPLTIMGMKEIT